VTEHTNGPWRQRVGPTTHPLIEDERGRTIAVVSVQHDVPVLAASTDMLAVLKQAREFIDLIGSDDDAVQIALLADVDRAIARATGVQP